MDVFNINDLIYKVNINTTSDTSNQQTMEYKDVLDKIRHIISKNHSAELIDVIYSPSAGDKLKNLIIRYLNQNKMSVEECKNISMLADRIYEDMAGFGILTKYLQNEEVEEVNINAWNCIEVIYPDRVELLEETFVSPDDCMDKIKKMVWLGGSIIDGSNPKVDSYIGEGVRISALIPPCVDSKTGGVASIRRQKENVITRRLMIEYGSATPEELEFLPVCINNGVSLAIAGSTGSGKTTDLAYLISCLDKKKRIYTIEDTRELNIAQYENGRMTNRVVQTLTKDAPNPITMDDLLKEALRFHPYAIIPAEMRGAEAMTAIEAGRTGHVIISTLHANSAVDAYNRILSMCVATGYKLMGKANESQVKKVAEAIKGAKKPVILAGGGVVISDATNEFRKFVKETDIPVVSTMMGIGILPSDNPRYYGMIGSHGVKRANLLFNRADLVIVMGSRLGDRTVANVKGLEEGNKLIHIDLDPAEIGKNTQPYIPVVGDIKDVLEQLTSQISGYKTSKEWIDEADELRQRFTHKPVCEDNGFVNPKYFLNVLSEKTNSDVYLSTEVGQNQIWCANNFNFKTPRSLLTSGGFGTMGYGLPAAIGASVAANGSKPVIAVMGDGSFQMDLPEMGTMAQWDIPVKMVLFQNHRLGMVHEHQYLLYKSNYQAVEIEGKPDFAMLAKAYGFESGVANENSEVSEAIDKMMAHDGSYLLIVNVNPFEPTGDALNEATLPKKEDK